jgi:hypothetical protein
LAATCTATIITAATFNVILITEAFAGLAGGNAAEKGNNSSNEHKKGKARYDPLRARVLVRVGRRAVSAVPVVGVAVGVRVLVP